MLWLIAANPNTYKVELAFKELEYVDWKRNANYKNGDTIFIYVSKPVQAIKYMCEVINDNVNKNIHKDDKKYWLNQKQYEFEFNKNSYIRIKLIKEFNNDMLTLEKLSSHGLNGNIQGPRKLYDSTENLYSWARYIINNTKKYNVENSPQNNENTVLTVPINGTEDLIKKYNVHAHPLKNGYPNKITNYIAFREPGGIINNIYIIFDIKDTIPSQYINNDNVLKYIEERYPTFGFSNENTVYRFYILKDYIKLEPPYILSPNPQSAKYLELDNLINDQKRKESINSYEDDKLQIEMSKIKKSNIYFEYTDEIIPLPESKEINGIKVYKRDKQRAINALNHANYSCEIDKNHICFLRKDGVTPYTEAHHLIPLSFQYKFKNSLDIEENIISLFSNCHNEIHYGFNAKRLIKKLFEERKDVLKIKGINISLNELYEYYGL